MPQLTLTEEQQKIVCASAAHYVITAVAGSGKTTTLAYRIQFLLEQGYQAKRVLILMFNRAAKEDFSQKLRNVIAPQLTKPEVRTFHSMGYRLYQRFIKEGYLPPFQNNILSDKETDYHLWRLLNQTLDADTLKDAKRNKKEYIEISHQFLESVKSGLQSPETVFEALQIERKFDFVIELFNRFEHWRKQQSRISYSDMLYDPVMALRAHPQLAQLVANKMDILLVDEYQDTNEIQHELLKYIAGTRAKITVVGDPDQTIYEFRGAKPEYIIQGFSKEFPDALHLDLSYSFRYGHNISLLANHLISRNSGRRNLLCKSYKNNPSTSVKRYESVDDAFDIATLLAATDRQKLSHSAILARVWSQTVGIELALLAKEIPYHIEGHSGVFHSTETHSLRALLELASGEFEKFEPSQRQEKLELLFHFPHVGLPDPQIKAVCAYLAQSESNWGQHLNQSIPSDIKRIQAIKLERLARALIKVEKCSHPVRKLLNEYIDDTQLYEGIRSLSFSHDNAEEKVASIQGIARFISQKEGRAHDVLRYLDKLQSNSERQHSSAIHLSTIHRAKGLEWDTVFIPGLNDKNLPYSHRAESFSKAQLESERRLLYVAMTRAKQQLHLFVPKRAQPNAINPSRFEYELKFKQSLALGTYLSENQDKQHERQFVSKETLSEITKHYAKAMNCEIKEVLDTQGGAAKSARPVWLASTVQHCVLGQGIIKGEQSNSFSVEFDDQQIRTFSKETADRFFSAID